MYACIMCVGLRWRVWGIDKWMCYVWIIIMEGKGKEKYWYVLKYQLLFPPLLHVVHLLRAPPST